MGCQGGLQAGPHGMNWNWHRQMRLYPGKAEVQRQVSATRVWGNWRLTHLVREDILYCTQKQMDLKDT